MTHTVKMTLNGSFVDYDGMSTRASSKEWKNGDTLYLRFITSNDFIDGKAVYDDSSSGEWMVSYYGVLDKNSEMNVNVCFFDNPSLEIEGDILKLTPTTPCYWSLGTGTALYSPSEGLSISATLHPIGGRIRFKGKPGENIAVGGLTYYNSFELNPYAFGESNDFVYITVNKSGYTDYLYSTEFSPKQIKINKQEEGGWDYLYTLDCTENMIETGKSGWLNIPIPTSRNGWTMRQITGEENGHMWVDLGLPSGTLWADENVGADIAQWQDDGKESNVFGKLFNWGYTSSNTGCLGENDIQGSINYDTAKSLWNGRWVTPSKEDYEELLRYCKLTQIDNAYDEINAIKIDGEYGESIYIPYKSTSSAYNYFWASTPSENTNELDLINHEWIWTNHRNAWSLHVSKYGECSIESRTRYFEYDNSYGNACVRAVIK